MYGINVQGKRAFYFGCAVCALICLMSSLSPVAVYASVVAGPGVALEDGALPAEGEVTEEQIDQFFDGTVFVGDSVMLGYRNYAALKQGTWLDRPEFLASVSFSTYSALKPVTAKSLHPVYAGEKRLVEDSIALMGAKKVFLFFGLNDISITGIGGTRDNYVELVNRIKAQSPDAEIHLMSMTYVVHGKEKENLYNDNVRRYNDTMRGLAEEQGWGFVDVATPLADANGDLDPAYSSDKYVHLKNSAYDIWSAVLRDYAKNCILQARQAEKEAADAVKPEGMKSVSGPGRVEGAASMEEPGDASHSDGLPGAGSGASHSGTSSGPGGSAGQSGPGSSAGQNGPAGSLSYSMPGRGAGLYGLGVVMARMGTAVRSDAAEQAEL